jgi:hypothetical protein
MHILHSHWRPPRRPAETGGVVFWAEISDGPPSTWQRGRIAANPKPKVHPFCAPLKAIQLLLDYDGGEGTAPLRLPTTRSGPLPSPDLIHNWESDQETSPFLAPWIIKGLWLRPAEALLLLADLPELEAEKRQFTLGTDAGYWGSAASLALETLATHKLVPVLAPTDPAGKDFHARWLPVLDSPKDGPRLAQLEAAMPPVCRCALITKAPVGNQEQGERKFMDKQAPPVYP